MLKIFEIFLCIYRTNFNWCNLWWRHYIKGCVWLANQVHWLLIWTTTRKRKVLKHVIIFAVIVVFFIFSMSIVVCRNKEKYEFLDDVQQAAVWVLFLVIYWQNNSYSNTLTKIQQKTHIFKKMEIIDFIINVTSCKWWSYDNGDAGN